MLVWFLQKVPIHVCVCVCVCARLCVFVLWCYVHVMCAPYLMVFAHVFVCLCYDVIYIQCVVMVCVPYLIVLCINGVCSCVCLRERILCSPDGCLEDHAGSHGLSANPCLKHAKNSSHEPCTKLMLLYTTGNNNRPCKAL